MSAAFSRVMTAAAVAALMLGSSATATAACYQDSEGHCIRPPAPCADGPCVRGLVAEWKDGTLVPVFPRFTVILERIDPALPLQLMSDSSSLDKANGTFEVGPPAGGSLEQYHRIRVEAHDFEPWSASFSGSGPSVAWPTIVLKRKPVDVRTAGSEAMSVPGGVMIPVWLRATSELRATTPLIVEVEYEMIGTDYIQARVIDTQAAVVKPGMPWTPVTSRADFQVPVPDGTLICAQARIYPRLANGNPNRTQSELGAFDGSCLIVGDTMGSATIARYTSPAEKVRLIEGVRRGQPIASIE